MAAQTTPTTAQDEPLAPNAAYHRDVLHELIDMGLGLARKVHARAMAEPPEQDAAAEAASVANFDRISRAIRRTVALDRTLDAPVPAHRRDAARRRIIRDVEDAIERRRPKDADRERLGAELDDRLDRPELDDEIDHRPIEDIIADICRDLGIAAPPGFDGPPPWKRRTPAEIAAMSARAARARAPAAPSAEPRSLAPASVMSTDPDRPGEPERLFRLFATPNNA